MSSVTNTLPDSTASMTSKDYFATLGAMESAYGFAGTGFAPTPSAEFGPRSAAPKSRSSKMTLRSLFGSQGANVVVLQPQFQSISNSAASGTKDYNAAFARMSSAFGLPAGGAAVPRGHWRSGVA
jgi:hypothetical protein